MSKLNILIESNNEGIIEASELLKLGKLVAFPTETVYGLGANALNEKAVLSIFEAKGRPLTDPLIVHVTDKESAKELIDFDVNTIGMDEEKIVFDALSDNFWPGPLTIIALASSIIPKLVTAGTGYVGVRVPSHPLALSLLSECKLPIAAPSANRFGHVSPTRAQHVIDDLGNKGVRVLNGDNHKSCDLGIESTVAKISGIDKCVHIFRQGGITKQQIQKVIDSLEIGWKVDVVAKVVNMKHNDTNENHSIETNIGQEAPGQAVTHYAPDIPTYIISSYEFNNNNVHANKKIITAAELAAVVIIDFGGKMKALEKKCLAYRDLSSLSSANEGANKLFETLRWAESCPGASQVFLSSINNHNNSDKYTKPTDDLTDGLADRIFRAGSGVYLDILVSL